jgi:hypothetical protein
MREKEETPEIERENRDRAKQILDGFPEDLLEGSPARDYCEKLILENIRLRAEKDHVRAAERSPGKRERETLLTIIASLAKAAKVPLDDYAKPGKASGYIEGLTDELGAHVSKRAIEEHLKKIPDALATRMK